MLTGGQRLNASTIKASIATADSGSGQTRTERVWQPETSDIWPLDESGAIWERHHLATLSVPRFTIRSALAAVAVAAWLAATFTPGGAYVYLPVGAALVLTIWFAYAASVLACEHSLARRSASWSHIFASMALLAALISIYSAWWPLASERYQFLKARQFVQQYMNAEAIRDVARTLIDRQPPIARPGEEIPLDPAEWPMEIRSLAPRAVEVAPELVTIRFGKLGRGKGFCIFVFRDEAEGFGTVRLAPGIWYWEAGTVIGYDHRLQP